MCSLRIPVLSSHLYVVCFVSEMGESVVYLTDKVILLCSVPLFDNEQF